MKFGQNKTTPSFLPTAVAINRCKETLHLINSFSVVPLTSMLTNHCKQIADASTWILWYTATKGEKMDKNTRNFKFANISIVSHLSSREHLTYKPPFRLGYPYTMWQSIHLMTIQEREEDNHGVRGARFELITEELKER